RLHGHQRGRRDPDGPGHGPGAHHRHRAVRPRPALPVEDLQSRLPQGARPSRPALDPRMTDPLVTTAWLAERLQDPDVQVVDATWYMPGEAGSGAADYAAGHIPGAVFFDIDQIADQATDLP